MIRRKNVEGADMTVMGVSGEIAVLRPEDKLIVRIPGLTQEYWADKLNLRPLDAQAVTIMINRTLRRLAPPDPELIEAMTETGKPPSIEDLIATDIHPGPPPKDYINETWSKREPHLHPKD